MADETAPTVRALVNLPPVLRRGEPFEVRLLVAHPMETGQRADSSGVRIPRDIVRRVECRLDGDYVFAADLRTGIAANPFITFSLVAHNDGLLVVTWSGDNGFGHSVQVPLKLQ